MKTETIYQWVKASERLPERSYKGIIKSDFGMIYGTSFFYRAYDKGRINIEQWYWLSETTVIIITPEEKEKAEDTTKQQDEIIGRLTREVEYLTDSQIKRIEWLMKAKREAGYADMASFDEVWKDALTALKYVNQLNEAK